MKEEIDAFLPEDWYNEVKGLFQIKIDDETIKDHIKPVIIGISHTLGEHDNAMLRHRFAEICEDTRVRIAVLTDKHEIVNEFHKLAFSVANITPRITVKLKPIEDYMIEPISLLKRKENKNSKGKRSQKGSKYF